MPAVSQQQQKFMGIVRAIQKGDAKPGDFSKKARDAAKKMKKKGKEIIWQVIEKPTNNVVSEYFFDK